MKKSKFFFKRFCTRCGKEFTPTSKWRRLCFVCYPFLHSPSSSQKAVRYARIKEDQKKRNLCLLANKAYLKASKCTYTPSEVKALIKKVVREEINKVSTKELNIKYIKGKD